MASRRPTPSYQCHRDYFGSPPGGHTPRGAGAAVRGLFTDFGAASAAALYSGTWSGSDAQGSFVRECPGTCARARPGLKIPNQSPCPRARRSRGRAPAVARSYREAQLVIAAVQLPRAARWEKGSRTIVAAFDKLVETARTVAGDRWRGDAILWKLRWTMGSETSGETEQSLQTVN